MNRNIFNSVKLFKPKKSYFDLSHDRKFSCDMGQLIPILSQEVLPGDKFTINAAQMVRFAPMVAPMMHRVDVYTHYFFVPNRLLWSNWERFITGGERLGDILPIPTAPYINIDTVGKGTVADYFGLPVGAGYNPDLKVSALPFQAYAKIYDEYYRDENLVAPLIPEGETLIDGNNSAEFIHSLATSTPLHRAWEHDYFTSALPFAQKGDEVLLPLGDSAPIVFDGNNGNTKVWAEDGTSAPSGPVAGNIPLSTNDDGLIHRDTFDDASSDAPYQIDVSENHLVDLESATAASVNDLRRAFKVQEWLEKNARGGTRYVESLLAHFGVRSSDARLQRPQYLGGGKSPVSISEVLQTSESATTPQGNLSGHGINVGQAHSFSAQFEEHGFIIGIMSVMPKPSYYQGVNKMFKRFDVLDYAWPTLAHLGEQEVKGEEIYIGDAAYRENTFGYVPRYAEYRYASNTVHGDFRDTLEYWHLGRKFATPPLLNDEFIHCVPDNRIFSVVDGVHHLWCQVHHKIDAFRPLPKFGTPSI